MINCKAMFLLLFAVFLSLTFSEIIILESGVARIQESAPQTVGANLGMHVTISPSGNVFAATMPELKYGGLELTGGAIISGFSSKPNELIMEQQIHDFQSPYYDSSLLVPPPLSEQLGPQFGMDLEFISDFMLFGSSRLRNSGIASDVRMFLRESSETTSYLEGEVIDPLYLNFLNYRAGAPEHFPGFYVSLASTRNLLVVSTSSATPNGIIYVFLRTPSDDWEMTVINVADYVPEGIFGRFCGSNVVVSSNGITLAASCQDGSIITASRLGLLSTSWAVSMVEGSQFAFETKDHPLAISDTGMQIAVGQPYLEDNTGGLTLLAFSNIFRRWEVEIVIHPSSSVIDIYPDIFPGALFGSALAWHKDILAVGAPKHPGQAPSILSIGIGGIYLLRYDESPPPASLYTSDYIGLRYIDPVEIFNQDVGFGSSSLALTEKYLLVGAPYWSPSSSTISAGCAYVIPLENGTQSIAPLTVSSALFDSFPSEDPFPPSPLSSSEPNKVNDQFPTSSLSIPSSSDQSIDSTIVILSISGAVVFLFICCASLVFGCYFVRRRRLISQSHHGQEKRNISYRGMSAPSSSAPRRSRSGSSRSRSNTSQSAVALRRQEKGSRLSTTTRVESNLTSNVQSDAPGGYEMGDLGTASPNYSLAPLDRKETTQNQGYSVFCDICKREFGSVEDLQYHKNKRH